MKQGIDVLICYPRLVQTGLDLIDFPTFCSFETEFAVFKSTQRQYGSHGQWTWTAVRATE